MTISVLTNAIDGWAHSWLDGTAGILQSFARNGAPTRKVRDWGGRWWSLWSAVDLVPMGAKVLVANPGLINPLADAGELEITGRTTGRIAVAPGFASHGEAVRCARTKSGRITALKIAGTTFLSADKIAREMEARYGKMKPGRQRGAR